MSNNNHQIYVIVYTFVYIVSVCAGKNKKKMGQGVKTINLFFNLLSAERKGKRLLKRRKETTNSASKFVNRKSE